MRTGRSLPELAAEVERRRMGKLDLLADTRELMLRTGEPGSELEIGGQGRLPLRELAHEQIADHLEIPRRYYGRLRERHRGLFDETVNTLFREAPSRRLVRALDGRVRAFLSDRYRRLDHEDLCEAVLPVLGAIPDVSFPSVEVTETHLYLKAVAPRVSGEVRPGDVVQAGVVISNSEVGMGALVIRPLVFRLVCANGMIVDDALRRHHVGRHIEVSEGGTLYGDETLRADDRAFWLKVRDLVGAAVTESRFASVLDRLRRAAASTEMSDPGGGVRELGRCFGFSVGEQGSVLRHLTLGGDLTRYGAVNAVTSASQEAPAYDRATELEAVAGSIMDMDVRSWARIAGPGAAS
ncbi:MAG TPA: DUF932 domain-containing protein [Candidatus Dormibacteraeota bacterium]|jgi:hypothetical protein|nr:DUF932 domain-containing protein [Candidatus Dormibacteraeota bacterium]